MTAPVEPYLPCQPPSVIVNLHGIGTPHRTLEPGEAPFWIERDLFLRLLDDIASREANQVGITFDDGNASDIEIAAPELLSRGLRATFFPLAGRIGRPGSLSAPDIAALVAQGHGIGSHGFDHVDWRALDASGARREFDIARDLIAAAAGRPVTEAAVPFGKYNRGVIGALRARGFRAVNVDDRGRITGDPFVRQRNCIVAGMDGPDLRDLVTGRLPVSRLPRRWIGLLRKRVLPARLPG